MSSIGGVCLIVAERCVDECLYAARKKTIHRVLTAVVILEIPGTWNLALVIIQACNQNVKKMWSVPLCTQKAILTFRVLAGQFVGFPPLPQMPCLDHRIHFSYLNLDTPLPLQCASTSCLASRRPWISLGSCVPPASPVQVLHTPGHLRWH